MIGRPHRLPSATTALVVVALLAAVGCNSDATPTSPSLPAPTANASFGTQSTSAIVGQLLGGGSFGSASQGATPGVGSTAGMQVSIDGTNISTRTSADGRFMLTGVPNGNITLHFAGNGANAILMLQGVAANQLIQITIQVAGTSAQLVSEDRDELDEFDGRVVAVNPAATGFTLDDGTTIATGVGTRWDTDGDLFSFAELAEAFDDGLIVRVEGRAMSTPEGTLLASAVKAETDEDDQDFAEPTVEQLRLDIDPDKWSLGWVGNGSSGNGNSAVVVEVDHGPFADILGSSIEMEGPDGIVTPFDTGIHEEDFEARFTKAQAISIAASAPADSVVEIFVRGTLLDGTPWELSGMVEIAADDDEDSANVDDDDSDDHDGDDDEQLDPGVAAQAIVDLNAVIAGIDALVGAGDLAPNDATPLISKLQAAIGSLEKLNREPAVNQLEAFLNQLNALEETDRISEDAAEILEEDVENVIDAIED